jgi:ribosomal protein S12
MYKNIILHIRNAPNNQTQEVDLKNLDRIPVVNEELTLLTVKLDQANTKKPNVEGAEGCRVRITTVNHVLVFIPEEGAYSEYAVHLIGEFIELVESSVMALIPEELQCED